MTKTAGVTLAGLTLCGLVAIVLPPPTLAAPLMTAGTGCNGPFGSTSGPGIVESSCDVTTAGTFSPNAGNLNTTAFSSAGPGFIKVRSQAQVLALNVVSGFNLITAQASGEWLYNDFIIRGPTSSVLAALNLRLDGVVGNAVIHDDDGTLRSIAAGNAQFFIQIDLNGTAAGFGELIRRNRNGVEAQTVDGLLVDKFGSDLALSGLITSSELTLPVGSIFSVHVLANVGANASGLISGSPADEFDLTDVGALATSDFSATVEFPKTGPVFVLPPGYTVESLSAGIANNRVVAVPQAASEPAALFLLGTGLLSLLHGVALRQRGDATQSARATV